MKKTLLGSLVGAVTLATCVVTPVQAETRVSPISAHDTWLGKKVQQSAKLNSSAVEVTDRVQQGEATLLPPARTKTLNARTGSNRTQGIRTAQAITPSCPAGYVLSGSQCIPSAPVPSCPTGYSFSNGSCVPKATGSANSGGSNPGNVNSWSIIVNKALGVSSALELSGAAICFVSGSGGLGVATDYFHRNNMDFTKVVMNSNGQARQAYEAGRCDGYLVKRQQSVSTLRTLNAPNNHQILPQNVSCRTCTQTTRPIRQAPPVDLAYELQTELKRIGCMTGRVDGDWGSGSRAALARFSNQAGLRLGREPSQQAIDEARNTAVRYCKPVRRAAPKRKRKKKRASATNDFSYMDCNDLWHARNEMFAVFGYCFKSARGKKAFHNNSDYPNVCSPPYGKLSSTAKADVAKIKQVERQKSCR